ncbi:MAG: hypothetical protein ACI97A_003055 [Planctomycetota bacterium]|jgi:uncharacterized protein (DUF58 family)
MRDSVTPSCGSGWVLAVIGLISTFAGLRQDSASTAAFGSMLICFTFYLSYVVRHASREVVLTQRCPERIFEGESVEVRVILTNKSLRPHVHARFSEWPTVAPSSRRRLVFSAALDPGETTERRYEVRCEVNRGRYQASTALLRISDPFGLFEARRHLATDNEIIVLPSIHEIPKSLLLATGLARIGVTEQHRRLGSSNEFMSVREYRRGDPRRRILWKQSARRNDWVVRENFAESEGGLVIVIDRNVSVDAPGVGTGILDQAARLAASLSHRANKCGESIALVTGPDEGGFLQAGRSTEHMFQLMERLADVSLSASQTLPIILSSLHERVEPNSQICVITTLNHAQRQQSNAVMHRLTREGHRVVVAVLPSPKEEPLLSTGMGDMIDGIRHVWVGWPSSMEEVA